MAIQLKNTKDFAQEHGIKILVHGQSDAGKTFLASTAKDILVLNTEKGLTTLQEFNIPYVDITSIDDINQAYDEIASGELSGFNWIMLDSVSDIAEIVLSEEKALTKDPRKAYGELQDQMMRVLRGFRDLKGKNVVFNCKQDYIKDEQTGYTRYSPMLPGQNLAKNIPYMFDFVLALRKDKDDNDQWVRYFQCESDLQYVAKNRGGKLDMFEPADLTHIVNKLTQSTKLKEVK